jgi:hypothetical protein
MPGDPLQRYAERKAMCICNVRCMRSHICQNRCGPTFSSVCTFLVSPGLRELGPRLILRLVDLAREGYVEEPLRKHSGRRWTCACCICSSG